MLLELLKWIRSKRAYIVLFICSLSGITSPLIAYYSEFIIKNIGGNSATKILLPTPTWESLIGSYFKNVEQLVLFIIVFLIAQACIISKSESLKLFYTTRSDTASKIFFPRVWISMLVSTVGIIIGDMCAMYMVGVFFDNEVRFLCLISAFAIHLIAFFMFILLGATISIWISSPFFAASVVEIIALLSNALVGTELYDKWIPSSLLSPTKYLTESIDFDSIWRIILMIVIIIVICIFAIRLKPIKK